MPLEVSNKWKLDEALELIRSLQPKVKTFGFHCCLGGGVLNRGESKKDLDLYFLSLGKPKEEVKGKELVEWLEKLWGTSQELGKKKVDRIGNIQYFHDGDGHRMMHILDSGSFYRFSQEEAQWVRVEDYVLPLDNYPEEMGSITYAFKGKFDYSGLRIDVFILGGEKVEIDRSITPKAIEGVEGGAINIEVDQDIRVGPFREIERPQIRAAGRAPAVPRPDLVQELRRIVYGQGGIREANNAAQNLGALPMNYIVMDNGNAQANWAEIVGNAGAVVVQPAPQVGWQWENMPQNEVV